MGLVIPNLKQEAPHWMVKRLPRVAGKVLAAVGLVSPNLKQEQGWAKLVLIALERYSVALKRLTFNLR